MARAAVTLIFFVVLLIYCLPCGWTWWTAWASGEKPSLQSPEREEIWTPLGTSCPLRTQFPPLCGVHPESICPSGIVRTDAC